MLRIVRQTPADQDQGSAVEEEVEEVTTNPTAAAEDKAVGLPAMAEALIMEVEAAMVAGTVGAVVDKEVGRMAEDNRTEEVEANKVVVVAVAMVSNNNTKVNKVAILDSSALSCGVEVKGGRTNHHFEIPSQA